VKDNAKNERCEVFTVVMMKIKVFWYVMSYGLLNIHKNLELALIET
jgi:hypothetical protein